MRILPAIDIKSGKCVRLAKGDYSKVTHYFDDPILVAKTWVEKGASSIHIVDLDGAKNGLTPNYEIIHAIRLQELIPHDYKDKVIIDLAVKNMKLAVHGWESESEHTIEKYLKVLEKNDICEIVYTDVDKDGMLNGMNFNEMNKLLEITRIPMIASGGVSSLDDIKNLLAMTSNGISGVIIGKALYEEKIDLLDIFKITGT